MSWEPCANCAAGFDSEEDEAIHVMATGHDPFYKAANRCWVDEQPGVAWTKADCANYCTASFHHPSCTLESHDRAGLHPATEALESARRMDSQRKQGVERDE